jgi:hypothetical protein
VRSASHVINAFVWSLVIMDYCRLAACDVLSVKQWLGLRSFGSILERQGGLGIQIVFDFGCLFSKM